MDLESAHAQAAEFRHVGDEIRQMRVAFAEHFVDVCQQRLLLFTLTDNNLL
jgi:hypothetical protein